MRIKKNIKKIRDKAINVKNLIIGHKNYDKFIVITRSRTGSNLLISLLNSHPNIDAKGELFRRLEGKSSQMVWNNIFSKKPNTVKYVGFKIFYYHPMDSEDKDVWNYIKNDKNIKILHLVRLNTLRTIVSRQIADKTNKWSKHSKNTIQVTDKQVEIDVNFCLKELKLTKDSENKIRNEFKSDFFMELTYEDLIKDNQGVMTRIFNFLGIIGSNVKSSHKKQNSEKLEDLIINYDELKEAIKKTEWSYLLNA